MAGIRACCSGHLLGSVYGGNDIKVSLRVSSAWTTRYLSQKVGVLPLRSLRISCTHWRDSLRGLCLVPSVPVRPLKGQRRCALVIAQDHSKAHSDGGEGDGVGGCKAASFRGISDYSSQGVIIVDHGSRRAEANAMLDAFVEIFKKQTGRAIVEPAHMEIAQPSIASAFGSCVQQGARSVLVAPFFLAPGRHWREDIPSLVADSAKNHPQVEYLIAAPLGLHPLLAQVVDERLSQCQLAAMGSAEGCEVCVSAAACEWRRGGETETAAPHSSRLLHNLLCL
eukprot:TRINITY_DN2607_c0_g1_i2.p1 TRINITY_DN2607_c0_g1~~TRINITY_DN2607_c0_g1_i2.p1  ORF type:complete len:298 (+),score=24.01 TRINITY_DN2607_c0_g1_i2:54-896(+)